MNESAWEAEAKEKILQAIRLLVAIGVMEGNTGHVSIRDPQAPRMLLPGHLHVEGITFEEMTPEYITSVNLETYEWEGRLEPPEEFYLHSEIYRRRPKIGSVIHTHPTYAVALSLAGMQVVPVHNDGLIFGQGVPIFSDHRRIDTEALAKAMADAMGRAPALVLEAHGAVTAGADVEEAFTVMYALETCARLQHLAACVGPVKAITARSEEERRLSRGTVRNTWNRGLRALEVARKG